MLAFLTVSALVIVTPGPDTALTIRNTLFSGRSGGFATAAGVAAGQVTWTLFTAAGVAALLHASQPAFLLIRIAGAAYLVFLGAQSIIGAIRRRSTEPLRTGPRARRAGAGAVRQGLFSNLANPKMAVFFISLLPQFTGGGASFASFLALGLVFSLMTFVWLTVYTAAVARLGGLLQGETTRRALDVLAGAVLVGLGLRVASESA